MRSCPVRADHDAASTSSDYLAERLAVHEELVTAIRLGDRERARTAIVAHRGDDASGVGAVGRLPTAVTGDMGEIAQVQIDVASRPSITGDGERIAALERENQELRRANVILTSASAFFAAELSAERPG